MKPPIADKQNYSFEIHGQKITDDYHWLHDPNWTNVQDPKILEYLKAENKYTDNFFADLQHDKEQIFEELKGRIKLDDESAYVKKKDYYYYTRTEGNKNYPIYCRKYKSTNANRHFSKFAYREEFEGNTERSTTAYKEVREDSSLGSTHKLPLEVEFGKMSNEEIILDVNLLNPNGNFTDVATVALSSEQNLMAYSVNFTGSEKYDIKIYDLKKQKYLQDEVKGAASPIIWHEKLDGFFYITINENLRWDKVMFHYLGNDSTQDKLIFEVKNPLHFIEAEKSASHEYLFINSGDHNENEIYIVSMNDDSFTPKLVRPLQNNIFYDVAHNGDFFYIKTNYEAKNFRVVKVPVNNFQNTNWDNDYVNEEQDKYLKSFDITDNYLILNYRHQGLPLIKIKHFNDSQERILHFPDSSFQANSYSTNFEEDDIRVDYSSLARPNTTYKYDFDNNKLELLKQQEIPSGFNPDEYKVERIFADNENVKIPITLFYKKSLFKKDGSNPLYLMGYGAYGIAMPVNFRNMAVTLADRGFVYAVAHTRGGDELGHEWYKAAKFLNKKRTFDDFIACSETLIKEKYTSKNNIVIMGGSAGGMLIGYVLNEKPELYKAAIAHVPFVDVLNTMLDDSLPLTLIEYNEWGNPKEIEYFNYIKSYSPYDNVKAGSYPALFVTCGISDPRVGYWEPAKWVAKLRTHKTDTNPLLLKINMDAGHKGSSGRFDYLKETAEEVVFILKTFDIYL